MGVRFFLHGQNHRMHIVMASKVLFATLVAVSSAASPPAPYAPQETYPDLPPVYNYQYGVNDPEYSGAVFSQQENRADYDTSGEYRVNLPDGRVQIVTYTAGPEGYVADVKYEGEAVYAEVKPYKPAPPPAYKPAPAPYKPVVKVAPAPVVKVVPAPAPYKPAPAPYKPAPVVYAPAPAPYKPAPVVKVAPAPYKPAPVVKVVPAPYKPAPVYHAAPVYHKPTGYHAAPLAPKYTPKKYGYQVVTTAAPEPEVKAVVEEEAAPVEEEAAAPAPVEEAAAPAPAPAPVEKAAPATEAPIVPAYEAPASTEAAAAEETYRRLY